MIETDENGQAMVCTGCGTTRTLASYRQTPGVVSCCPERHMIPVATLFAENEAQKLRIAELEALADEMAGPAWAMLTEWDLSNPMRTADFHGPGCECSRCKRDQLETALSHYKAMKEDG